MKDVERAGSRAFEPAANPSAGERRHSEGLTLALAVALAVGLGVAVGIWIDSRFAQTLSAGASRPTRLLPGARAPEPNAPNAPDAPNAPAARPSPCDDCGTASPVETTPARDPADKAEEARTGTDSATPTGVTRAAPPEAPAASRRADKVAEASPEAQGVKGPEAVAAASPDPSRPTAWEVGPLPKAGGRAAARANVERGAAQTQPGPCTLYASANSLNVRVGGAAPLILGGPGVGVRVNVSTPDSSNLELIYEGPAAGDRGWLRYSVRSIGRTHGLYTVRFSTPCGSQTIPVTVK